MKSLEDLNEFKQKAMEQLRLRESKESVRIVVGMGTCGIAAGAREVVGAILEELAKRKISDVAVTQTGCIGLCVKEPLVDVIVPGQPKVTYGNVDAAKARQIVAQHVVNGLVVGEWVVNKL
ncbi:MAG: (2Fe-2S) ferredoxin domain-containing protein [Syntrophomonadaceae bacterium]|nr:(2Fe-2S) ferredoxin domain-containing protein [Syntrophomonadaceae bacterium]